VADENNKVLIVLPTLYAALTLPRFLFVFLLTAGLFDQFAPNHRIVFFLLATLAILPYYFFNFVYNWLVYAMARF
jgi:hypothetical protein